MTACRFLLRSLCWGLLATAAHSAIAQSNEVKASAYRWMLDPEFLQPNPVTDPLAKRSSMGTYMDISTGSVWVFGVDPVTGNFIPDNGQGTLIQANADPVGSLGGPDVNGPEWSCGIIGAGGTVTCSSVYTRFVGGNTVASAFIGTGMQGLGSTWKTSTLSVPRNGPFGSDDPSNCARISYQDPQGYHYWRCLTDPTSEEMFPGIGPSGVTPAVRFVHGPENAALYPLTVNGVAQDFYYDLSTKVLTQLTSDAGSKNQPQAFHAPEYNNALALATLGNDKSEVDLYIPDSKGKYVKTVSLPAPSGTFLFSLEVFTYKGNSYGMMQAEDSTSGIPTGIYVADLNVAHPQLKRITAPQAANIAEADGEFFLTANGPIAYYSRFDSTKCISTASPWFCPQALLGLWRVNLDLPFASAPKLAD